MVTRLMRWSWPTGSSKKFAVKLIVRGIEGYSVDKELEAETRMKAVVRWKGKVRTLRSLRSVKRNCTREDVLNGDGGQVEWNEEFESVVVLTAHRENGFNPWEIEIAVFSDLKLGTKNKTSLIGMASLNLAEYAAAPVGEFELNLPLLHCSSAESYPIIHLSLKLFELMTCPQQQETVPKSTTSPSSLGDKEEYSSLKAGFRRVFREFMPGRKFRKTLQGDEGSDGKSSVRTEDSYYAHTYDTDSIEDDAPNEDLEYDKVDTTIRKSFCYGTLAAANMLGVTVYNDIKMNENHEDLIYYSHKRSDADCCHVEEDMPSIPEKSPKISILPWKKRKYSFRSPKEKGEPLLKKAYGEEGGDDIDYDRRLLSSDESLLGKRSDDDGSAHHSSISDFGDDNFAVGSWELKEIISRCGQMKLSTQVFFASIDQRSERAAGQSACTALVAVIADWFQSNRGIMPIKSQLDSLIREGSLAWRNLCKNQAYRDWFPDDHFDLETVLQAKIRPLSVVPCKSFIGFFHPEGCEGNHGFEFLHGAMSFDSIWEEIGHAAGLDCIFIVSWNDHFFVLKVEQEAYYIIDTLGERLYEGCDQAYILKFDKSTTIHKLLSKKRSNANGKEGGSCRQEKECDISEDEDQLFCNGKESCKEYIKNFLAAIPIRELQADTLKGLAASTPFHQRLQIEFHYTEASKDSSNFVVFPPPQSTGSTSPITWPAYPSPTTEQTLNCIEPSNCYNY